MEPSFTKPVGVDIHGVSTNEPDAGTCDPTEAPAGYYAVELSSAVQGKGNFCRQCDWRLVCLDPKTDNLAYGHRCSATPVQSRLDGKIYRRKDRCPVLFKKIARS